MWSQRNQAIADPDVRKWRFRSFLLAVGAVSLVSPVVLSAIDRFSIQAYFLVVFVCVLICGEIFAPPETDDGWWRRLRWLEAAGWLVLVYIVLERVLVVLQ
jgi:hypothetical protein